MYGELAQGGSNPILITEKGGSGDGMGGGVLAVLVVLIILAIAGFSVFNRREPIVNSNSELASLLPAMMVMTSQRQSVDVNSNNTNWNCGPTNFDIYRQGVATNDNVFVQSCQTRELVTADGNDTRNLINDNRMHDLELQVAEKNAQLIAKDNQLTSERQYNSLTQQNTANYSNLQTQIQALNCRIPAPPVAAYDVSPYGVYAPQRFYGGFGGFYHNQFDGRCDDRCDDRCGHR